MGNFFELISVQRNLDFFTVAYRYMVQVVLTEASALRRARACCFARCFGPRQSEHVSTRARAVSCVVSVRAASTRFESRGLLSSLAACLC